VAVTACRWAGTKPASQPRRRSRRSDALRLNEQAGLLRQEGRYDQALEASEQALELFRSVDDRRSEALTLNGMGLAQARTGDETGALDSYETAVALLSAFGDGHGAGRVLANLGTLHLGQGQEEEARAAWQDALERLEPGSPEHDQTAQQLRSAG
jgi:tetratricopeptide (TPR) repeat protein